MSDDKFWRSEPTIIKPKPGGERGRAAQAGSSDTDSNETTTLQSALRDGGIDTIDNSPKGLPFLVAAARPQLNLLYHLRGLHADPDAEQLRTAVIDEMRAYERKVANANVDTQHARVAHYALCATIDDVVLSTRWGGASNWASNSIVSTFHRDVQGGERFFELLEHFHKDPGRNRDILLLLYLCLSLGFKGRLRVSARGALELSQIRDSLYRTLQSSMGDIEREVSPHWRGINARFSKARFKNLYPALLGMLVLLCAFGYVGILRLLNTESDGIMIAMAAAPPQGNPSIKVEQPAQPPVEQVDRLRDFLAFLQPEVDRGVVTTARDGNRVLVRFRNTGFFETARADVNPQFQGLIDRIGRAIAEEKFSVHIVGHTDNRPMRGVRFPSNYDLSRARAQSVAAIIGGYVPQNQITFEGRGESEPIDTNDTDQGREANRRTEIIVTANPRSEKDKTTGAGNQQ
ncbi:type VI secretion system protein TssL, long form [Phyllobacterium myrsinacearum]|uniref:Type VI secretion system protein ImpK n=1 Tax=Phyllobacterium myrsinacearum TaxID=28101 RepID=A0A839EIB1_9HYPH|nr:type VI secretion system protein TssL, long form [Phyllobacterium myrsinacearum]MBA8879731.1 type VI secretion system protein ImpK [Phyllobacterium myrsinacearum]